MNPDCFDNCLSCLCISCKWRGSCSYQMRNPCNKEYNVLSLQCSYYKEKK